MSSPDSGNLLPDSREPDTPLRSSHVMLSAGFGGAERYCVDLVRALARRRHSVQAIVQRGSEAARQLAGISGVDLHEVRVLGAWDRWAARRVRHAIAAFAPDVVHGHLARGTYFGGHAAAALAYPMFTKLHNYVNLKYYRDVTQFIVTTTRQQHFLIEHSIPAARIAVIPNFSSLPVAVDASHPLVAPPRLRGHWVALGRFVHKKGFDVLIDAFARVAREYPDLRLTIGGDGDERATLERKVAALGLSERISLPGWIEAVGDFLDTAEGFVLPSRDEPFGIVVLEAMARGVPIVATRTDGPSEILDERTGWLCAIDDVDDLARVLADALGNADAREARAQAATRRYQEHYHEDAIVPRILALYQAACADRRTSRQPA